VIRIATPEGPAHAHVHLPGGTGAPVRTALVLGHGAGGGVKAPDLVAVRDRCLAEGRTVVLVEQPYRVAGKKSTPPTHKLDAAWTAVVEHLRSSELDGLALVSGGRSSGARVACRTAGPLGAAAVLCLAFPLVPPGGRRISRLPELEGVPVPTLVVQGTGDRFGMPPPDPPGRTVAEVPGDHGLRSAASTRGAADAVSRWLAGLDL
jgi:predicted alpha/beta-hydrolase family hydrolase